MHATGRLLAHVTRDPRSGRLYANPGAAVVARRRRERYVADGLAELALHLAAHAAFRAYLADTGRL